LPDVDAVLEKLLAYLARDPETGGGVLRIGDDEIDAVVLDERAEAPPHELAAGPPDDVADEEDAHGAIIAHNRADGNARAISSRPPLCGSDVRGGRRFSGS
jgi:hypothetical protein